ncbi:OpgC family protein [Halodurantibacterium flavum]|uniref:OpgC family protein n=1 Tax=Halodurantibacterium flavum TaxID=1382802 RepID=A0ABW4S9C2_9RHOB
MPDRPGGVAAAGVSALPATVVRDARLDVFRGLALVMIFINHVPGNVFEQFTSRNFGFSDAAEAFVLMSGISAGLAYSNGFRREGWAAFVSAAARVWGRAWSLYLVQMTITVMAIAICAAAVKYFGLYNMIQRNNLGPLFRNPLGGLIGLPTLGHQLGYLNILPLYIVLLLMTPAMFALGLRRPLALLCVSGTVWLCSGFWRINLPAYPNPGGWFFNPLAWQFLFVIGLCTGAAMKEGRRLVPLRPGLLQASIAFALVVFLWMRVPEIGSMGRSALAEMRSWGIPSFLAGFNKTYLALPRLLHVLALFYIVSALPAVRAFCQNRWLWPLEIMGRHALTVFAAGSVLCILLQAAKLWWPVGAGMDAFLIGSGLLVQLLLAMGREALARQRAAIA